MAFYSKFACGLLCLTKISTRQHLKGDKKIPVGKKSRIVLIFPHFSVYALTADCLSMQSLNCALSGSGAFAKYQLYTSTISGLVKGNRSSSISS